MQVSLNKSFLSVSRGHSGLIKNQKKKPGTVHDCIAEQAVIIKHLGRNWASHEAPDLAALLNAAVMQVRESPRRKTISYKGKRYQILISNLGRVIVCDKLGNRLASSNFGAV